MSDTLKLSFIEYLFVKKKRWVENHSDSNQRKQLQRIIKHLIVERQKDKC